MTHEPLSWLLLERYELGELSPAERQDVEARLAASEADRACLAQIRADQAALAPLPLSQAAAASSTVREPAGEILSPVATAKPIPFRPKAAPAPARGARWAALSAGLCAAAALLLLMRSSDPTLDPRAAPAALDPSQPSVPDPGIKGGNEVVVRLSGEHHGASPRQFAVGERFKVEITCPPRLGNALRLFVFQADEVFEPLPLPAPLACGNLVPWPGAFALDGSQPADVCVAWSTQLGAVHNASDLGPESSCTRLSPP